MTPTESTDETAAGDQVAGALADDLQAERAGWKCPSDCAAGHPGAEHPDAREPVEPLEPPAGSVVRLIRDGLTVGAAVTINGEPYTVAAIDPAEPHLFTFVPAGGGPGAIVTEQPEAWIDAELVPSYVPPLADGATEPAPALHPGRGQRRDPAAVLAAIASGIRLGRAFRECAAAFAELRPL